MAQGLRQAGVQPGDMVAVLLNNRLEYLETIYAVNRLGAAFLLLNYRLAPAEWEYLLGHAGTTTLVTEAALWKGARTVIGGVPALERVVLIDPEACELGTAHGAIPYAELVEPHLGVHVPDAPVSLDDTQRLMFTSGTTSRPKGVRLTYRNVLHKTMGQAVEFSFTPDDRVLVCGPLYHVGGMDLPGTGIMHFGGSMVLLPGFDAGEVLATIERERPTCLWLAPTMVNQVLEHPDLLSTDTSSVRFMINGGEKMPVPLMQRLLQAFPGCWISDAYGLSETVGGDTFMDRENMLTKLGSVGRPILGVEVRVVDQLGQDAPPGEIGEIILRGPKVFGGYWKDPEATARAIRDGWFHTGDVGRLDEEGYLIVEDRLGDLIISGGENISSSEIERVLYEHPGVLEAAVVSLPDEKWGQVPRAVVVLRTGMHTTSDELRRHCETQLARYKVPKQFDVMDMLPRTASGKVIKRELRKIE